MAAWWTDGGVVPTVPTNIGLTSVPSVQEQTLGQYKGSLVPARDARLQHGSVDTANLGRTCGDPHHN